MPRKTRIEGQVVEVGWEPNTSTSNKNRVYVLVKVKLTSTRQKDLAETQLKEFTEKMLKKKVVIFPEG